MCVCIYVYILHNTHSYITTYASLHILILRKAVKNQDKVLKFDSATHWGLKMSKKTNLNTKITTKPLMIT